MGKIKWYKYVIFNYSKNSWFISELQNSNGLIFWKEVSDFYLRSLNGF